MKKRIAMALSMLFVVLMLGACGTDPTTVDYNGYSYDDLEMELKDNVELAGQLADFYSQSGLDEETLTKDIKQMLISQYGFTEEQLNAGLRWMTVADEMGAYVGMDEESFKVEKSGNTLTSNIRLQFENRDVDFQVVYTYYSMEMSGVTVEPVYSMGEKLQKAGMNTLISMMVVFCVLILISLIISCFNIFPYLEKKKAERLAAQKAPEAADVQLDAVVAEPAEQPLTDDTELVAVIAAAIAASTGTSTSDFVVRSINRR